MGYLKSTSYLNADRIKYGTVNAERLPVQTGGDHSHANKTILDAIQVSLTTALKELYDGYESGKQNTLGFVPANANHLHDSSYEAKNSNIQDHVISIHAPASAQKNSDITKAEIEAKLTGEISTHTHAGGGGGLSHLQVMSRISLSV